MKRTVRRILIVLAIAAGAFMAYTNWAFNQLSDDKLPESYNECVSREAPLVGYTAAAAKCEDDEHTGS